MPSDHSAPVPVTDVATSLPALVIAAIAALALLPPLIGFAPYGEQTILQQVDDADSAQCQRFGFPAGTDKFAACKVDLAGLHQRHDEILTAYSF